MLQLGVIRNVSTECEIFYGSLLLCYLHVHWIVEDFYIDITRIPDAYCLPRIVCVDLVVLIFNHLK